MDDKKNKKKYVDPKAELVDFVDEDIITLSLGTDGGIGGGDNEEDY